MVSWAHKDYDGTWMRAWSVLMDVNKTISRSSVFFAVLNDGSEVTCFLWDYGAGLIGVQVV